MYNKSQNKFLASLTYSPSSLPSLLHLPAYFSPSEIVIFVISFVSIPSSHLKFKVTFGKRLIFFPSFVWCQENNDFWCGSQFTKVTSIIHGKAMMKPLYGAVEHWTLHPIKLLSLLNKTRRQANVQKCSHFRFPCFQLFYNFHN